MSNFSNSNTSIIIYT